MVVKDLCGLVDQLLLFHSIPSKGLQDQLVPHYSLIESYGYYDQRDLNAGYWR